MALNYFEDILRAVAFIEARLQEDLTVADVAAVNGLSSWHFQRIFHEEVGETIGSYVRRRRLASAWDELQRSDRKVIDVALDWQFGSSEAFSRAFKSEFGFSPQQKRKAGVKAAPYRRPKLDRSRLRYLTDHGKLVPEIRSVEAFTVVGVPVVVPSPFSQPHEYLGQIPGVWREFVSRMGEAGDLEPGVKIGVIEGLAAAHRHIHDDTTDYLAAAPEAAPAPGADKPLPARFKRIEIPAGTYAVFTGAGFHVQTQFLIDHVYSGWLPSADWARAEGPEFTSLDHRVHPLDPERSVVEYFLPVRKL